jgi:hypothetical protein
MSDSFSVRKISTLQDLYKVYQLVHDSYCQSGIANPSPDGFMIHHPKQDVVPQTHIFVAEIENKMIGTISFSIDNQFGLMVDEGFKHIIDGYRQQYKEICCIWRFAVLHPYKSNLSIMRKLIITTIQCVFHHEMKVSFITLGPNQESFYKNSLMMEVIAEGIDPNPFIKPDSANVILMRVHTENIPKKWIILPDSDFLG